MISSGGNHLETCTARQAVGAGDNDFNIVISTRLSHDIKPDFVAFRPGIGKDHRLRRECSLDGIFKMVSDCCRATRRNGYGANLGKSTRDGAVGSVDH